jgi:signal transduction histidine kinase
MADQATRCQKIIRDALDYARRPSGRHRRTDVGKLVLETIALLDYSLRAARVKVMTDLEPDLPRVVVNAEKVQQVFWNLLTNACAAMPDGGEIHIGSRCRGDRVEMTFRDTGEGIKAVYLKKVFEPFFTTKKQGEGTGLGLSICRSIMADCGGEISVRNSEGGGAEFCLRFPIER